MDVGAKGRHPDRLAEDIEATRQELSRTLDALQAKLSFRKRIDEAVDSVRERGRTVAGVVTQTAKAYPVPLLLVSLPVLWLVAGRTTRRHRRPRH